MAMLYHLNNHQKYTYTQSAYNLSLPSRLTLCYSFSFIFSIGFLLYFWTASSQYEGLVAGHRASWAGVSVMAV